jgi:hypothetical protein
MKLEKKMIWISLLILLSAGMGLAMAKPVEVTGLVPAKELGDETSLKPGLLPIYIYKLFKSADQIPRLDIKTTKEKVGQPILVIDNNFGKNDPIFDSGVSQSLGIQMNGLLKFSKPGKYTLKAKSNDGITVLISGKKTVWHPGVHSDHFSNEVLVDIQKPGWYPLMIKYFQRTGTATIVLYWQLPGETSFSIIPADAYSHEPVSNVSP